MLFKNNFGGINFDAIFDIPRSERLPELAKSSPKEIATAITISLGVAFESMNLARPMSVNQILDLADTIIDSSIEDRLSLEDVLLFLQGLVRGKYGKLYDSIDIPKFMELFEVYRQERHKEFLNIREEQHSNFKAMGDNTRNSKIDKMSSSMDKFIGSVGYLKSNFKTC